MRFIGIHLLLLFVVISQSAKDETDSIMDRARAVQVEMGDFMEKLLEHGEISKTMMQWQGEDRFLYEFSGEHAQNLKLKNIFDMLQNWNWYKQQRAPKLPADFDTNPNVNKYPGAYPDDYVKYFEEISLFKFNFGKGVPKIIGFRVSSIHQGSGKNAILVLDENKKALEYDKIFDAFKDSNLEPAKIAGYMLDALESTPDNQPTWPDVGEELRSKMLNLAVIMEAAEGARPTDNFYEAFKEASPKIHEAFLKNKGFKKLTTLFSDEIKNFLYMTGEGVIPNELYIEFADNYASYTGLARNRKDKNKDLRRAKSEGQREKLRGEIAKIEAKIKTLISDFSEDLPEHTKGFYDEMSIAKKGGDDELRNFLAQHEFELSEYQDLENLKKAIDSYDLDNTKTAELEEHLPSISESRYEAIFGTKRLQTEFDRFKDFIKKTILHDPKTSPEGILKVKGDGRVPGSGHLARGLLQAMKEGKIKTWKQFEKIFTIAQKDGLAKVRNKLLLFSTEERPEYKYVDPELLKEELRNIRGRKDALDKLAVGEATEGEVRQEAAKAQGAEGGKGCSRRRRKRAASCIKDNEKILDETVEWKGDNLRFQTVDEEGRIKTHELKIPVEEMSLSKFTRAKAAAAKVYEKIGLGMGVFGTIVNGMTAIQQFLNGNYGQGTFSAIRTLHSLGGVTKFNTKLQRVIVRGIYNKAAEKYGFEKITEKLTESIAREAGKAGKTFARLLEDIPFVGLAFDIYFITTDIIALTDESDKTPEFLKIAHLILDVETTLLTLLETFVPELEPFIEPFVIALTIIRMTIDDFYYDIKRELDKVKGKGFAFQVYAFVKGFVEGIGDFLTFGLVTQYLDMKDTLEYQSKLWHNMSDPGKYFNETLAKTGELDFNGGIMSSYGGLLSVTLNENGSFTMELPEVYVGKIPRSIKITFEYDTPANEIVLGVGEVSSPQYIHKELKLWMFIPVGNYDAVSGFLGHESTLYGRYYGNSLNNSFYAVQRNLTKDDYTSLIGRECDADQLNPTDFNELLSKYEYQLFGHDGNDKFFLGPQAANILGGNGKDLYYIPITGGRTIINNFALDEQRDTLFMNLSYSDIVCHRHEHNLVVHYCDSHAVIMKNWFIHGENNKYFQHINIVTNDEVVIDVVDTDISSDGEYQVTCYPVVVDKSRSKQSVTIDLSVGALSHVTRFVGTNFSDTVTGNDKNNQFGGGLGDDSLEGGEGKDSYIHKEGDGQDLINNYSDDLQNDTVMIGFNYDEIKISSKGNSLILEGSSSSDSIKMSNWYLGPEYQHALFVSKDYISFLVLGKETNPVKYPINIDFSLSDVGVNFNLTSENTPQGFKEVTEAMVNDIKVIYDSPFDDVIVGNIRSNIMTCSGDSDHLQGRSGSDTYVVKKTCRDLEILNTDLFETMDLLLLNCSSSDITMSTENSDLLIKYQQDQVHHVVRLIDWFVSSRNQHLIAKTQDKWTFLPPESLETFTSYIEPYEIETTESCDGSVKLYDFNQSPFEELQRFLANASNCRFVINGNSQNNYIDPGPSDSYGYQVLTGGNGSDTYVFGHNYGVDNAIHNYATDGQYDHILFNVIYSDIRVEQFDNDIVLSSISVNNSVNVSLHDYILGDEYQHIFIHASDGIIFQVKYQNYTISREVALIDYSDSRFSQIISPTTNNDTSFAYVRGIFGSQIEDNIIHGGNETMKIVGGNSDDEIHGGNFTLGEEIYGMDGDDYIDGNGGDDSIAGGSGNDTIFGGDGNDDFYGGEGADEIDGGDGIDSIVFSGDGETASGVLINLVFGIGVHSDAEGDRYVSIENIRGSEFNDTLIGNGGDNLIKGNGGDDYIIPGGGFDTLEGGLDADIYDMTEAYGLKIINNFAADDTLDTVYFSDVSFDEMCYFYLADDLNVVAQYNNSNATGAMTRALLYQEYLEVQLLFWSRNESYRHIGLMFSDAYVHPEDTFTAIERDFNATSTELQDETTPFISITSITETSVTLTLEMSSLSSSNPLPDDAAIHYIHYTDLNTTSMSTFDLSYNDYSGFSSAIVSDLKSGEKQYFVVLMSICQVRATISSMLAVTTIPNPPATVDVSAIPGGFDVEWTGPDNETDPNVLDYNYTINYWQTEKPNEVYTIEYEALMYTRYEIFANHLHPKKEYVIAVASRINETISQFLSSNPVIAGDSICSNFNSLPAHMYIERVELVNGNSRAYLACDDFYEINGQDYYDCDVSVPVQPYCTLVRCDAVHDSVLKAIPVHASVAHGETNDWTCFDHYELVGGGNTFTSTCHGTHGWVPPLQTCVQKPACSPYPSIQDGFIQPSFAYRDEQITFSCQDHYSREGPEKKTCVASGQSVVYSPSTNVQCIRKSCPTLLPQPHGTYSLPSGNFVDRAYLSGEVVNLQCNNGYYVRDDANNPDKQTLTCTIEGHWSVQQQECRVAIYFTGVDEYLFYIYGYVQCHVSGWSGCNVAPGKISESFACETLGGHTLLWKSSYNTRIKCSRNVHFTHHPSLSNGNPNTYAGRLTIEYPSGATEVVCADIKSSYSMQDICSQLGYSTQYTEQQIIVGGYSTTKEVEYSSSLLIDKSQTCTKMLSCRGTCDPLIIPGLAYQCNKLLEGETCILDCPPGSARIGPREKVCQSNGQWSGDSTSCDDDQWKTDADNEVIKAPSGAANSNLAQIVATSLANKYPDVTWVVVMYNAVYGYDEHTIYSSSHYVYLHFRYNNKNFAVGRYTTSPVTSGLNLASELSQISLYHACCKKYCGSADPLCWFPWWDTNAEVAASKIWNSGIRSNHNVPLAMVVRGDHAKAFFARKTPSGYFHYANFFGNAAPGYVTWDRRFAFMTFSGCEGRIDKAIIMAD